MDASQIFEGATFTFEDERYAYGQQRFITLGLLRGRVVVIAQLQKSTRLYQIEVNYQYELCFTLYDCDRWQTSNA